MVSFLAPIVMILVLSGMLYKTNPVWGKHEYDMQASGWDPSVAEDFDFTLPAAISAMKIAGNASVEDTTGHTFMR